MRRYPPLVMTMLLLRLTSSLKAATANDNPDFTAVAARAANDNPAANLGDLSGDELVAIMDFFTNEAEYLDVKTALLCVEAEVSVTAARLGVDSDAPVR